MTKPAEGSAAEPHAEPFALGPEIGVCGIGPTRQAAFEPAAFALGCAITDPARIVLQEAIEVTCEAPDDTYLPIDLVCHMPAVEPKGATLTSLKVAIRDDGAWVAQFVLGTPSAIVVGPARRPEHAFATSCHGAGRRLSWHQALKQWDGRQVVDERHRRGNIIKRRQCGASPKRCPVPTMRARPSSRRRLRGPLAQSRRTRAPICIKG